MEEKLFEKGFEEFPKNYVMAENIFFILYFTIGCIGMLPLKIKGFPIVSFVYILFLAIMLIFVLRKYLCTHCYYYGKRCSTGWGKLSALLFRRNTGNYRLGVTLASITWGTATLLPILGILIGLFVNYSFLNLVLFFVFVIFSFVSFLIHRKACENCKMRLICPLSMASDNEK